MIGVLTLMRQLWIFEEWFWVFLISMRRQNLFIKRLDIDSMRLRVIKVFKKREEIVPTTLILTNRNDDFILTTINTKLRYLCTVAFPIRNFLHP